MWGGSRAWPFLNTVGKKPQPSCQLYSWLLTTQDFHGIQAFLVICWTEREKKKIHTACGSSSTVPVWTPVKCWASALSAPPTPPSWNAVFSTSQSTLPTKCTDYNLEETKKVSALGHLLKYAKFRFMKVKVMRKKKVIQIRVFLLSNSYTMHC